LTAPEATGGGRQAAHVAAGILLSRVLGYVRQRAIAYYIGNGWAADALSVAQRIPNIIRSLLAEGTLSASFIPVYAALNARADKGAARALAGAILGLLLLATGVLAVIGIAFAPALTAVFGAGLTGDARTLAVSLMRLLFPMSGLMVVSAWCLGILNTHRRFFLPYAAPAVWNIAGIAALVAAGTWLVAPTLPTTVLLTRLSLALAWGTVVGSVLQVAVQLPACWRVLHGIPLRWSRSTEGVRDVLVAWLPVVLGAGVAQISGLMTRCSARSRGRVGHRACSTRSCCKCCRSACSERRWPRCRCPTCRGTHREALPTSNCVRASPWASGASCFSSCPRPSPSSRWRP